MRVGMHLGYQNLDGTPDHEFFLRHYGDVVDGALLRV